MNTQEASLIVRMEAALHSEGIGPVEDRAGDQDLVQEALRLAASDVNPAFLWWAGEHDPTQVRFADPWKKCTTCKWWVDGFREPSGRLVPCGHKTYDDVCTSWSPVDGCTCASHGWVHDRREPQPGDRRVY